MENKELNAEEVMAQLKKEIEQKKIEVEEAKKASDVASKEFDRRRSKFNRLPWTSDVALRSIIAGGVSALVSGGVSNFFRDGGNIRSIDNYREYFLNHPDKLEYAKEVTGSSDLDYVCGFVGGDDSAAQALYAASGLKDFFWDNMCAAGVDAALIGAAVFGIPIVASIAFRKYYDKKDKQANEKYYEAWHKQIQIEREYGKLNAELEKMEKAEQQKAEVPKQEKVAENAL